jgi:hypothetical protein
MRFTIGALALFCCLPVLDMDPPGSREILIYLVRAWFISDCYGDVLFAKSVGVTSRWVYWRLLHWKPFLQGQYFGLPIYAAPKTVDGQCHKRIR